MSSALDDVDRRIAAALVQDGRASWRRIAAAIGEPERSVARRGARLLDEGVLRVLAIPNPRSGFGREGYVLRVDAAPADLQRVAHALADRGDVPWVSVLASSSSCIGEAYLLPGGLSEFLSEGLAAIPGLTDYRVEPITRYHRTSSGWRPDVLTPEQQVELGEHDERAALFSAGVESDQAARTLLEAMADDGRATAQSLAERLSVSKATISARIDRARASGQIFIRGVVSPKALGLGAEAHLRLEPRLAELDAVANRLAALSMTRVCAVVGTVVTANVATTDVAQLERELAALAVEFPSIEPIRIDHVADGLKRSGIRFVDERPAAGLHVPVVTSD
ncbi:transcriptional regulator, AsnC family [Agromyces sp. CF514]|uniref:Lrp/AsnC family transcriptional regulator n=1 Tax=Agromyces sp. CF514 TaxID=1881031 RepID=UPI0008E0072E|nr:AsnC family transcriptional regulator [Agromyces sp. CF514]SFR91803.1 transcriptional regulator, AsnC family [Agromyces sp. CF514]